MTVTCAIRILVSLLLIGSILGPTILSWSELDTETIVHVDTSDEENNEESKKELDEKEFFLSNSFMITNLPSSINNHLEDTFNQKMEGISFDILLPPPRS